MRVLLLIASIIILIAPLTVKASSYDIYVDESYSEDDSDGSSDKPYKEIEDAIKDAKSGNTIYVKNGTYEERFILTSGISIIGQDKNKVIIKGSAGQPAITAESNNTLKNITVTGGHTGILFKGKGSIENCIIKGVSGDAINLAEGSGTVTIKNSNINNNTKGLYAQNGSSFNISNSNFENNSGEGIDIRENTSGSISGNYIANNKESGIEIVVGSSEVSIKNNTIKKNRASGIAAQFYSQNKKIGEILISKNNISYNSNFGIDCKAPSGGNTPKGYYNKSLELKDNKIERNKRKSISRSCKIIEAVTEEEEKSNQAIESETANSIPEDEAIVEGEETELEAEEIRKKEEEARILSEKKITIENTFAQINSDCQELVNDLNQTASEIRNRNKTNSFLFGPDYRKINEAKREIAEIEQIKNYLSETAVKFENIGDTEKAIQTANLLTNLEDQATTQNSLIAEEENKFSLFGWAFKIFIK